MCLFGVCVCDVCVFVCIRVAVECLGVYRGIPTAGARLHASFSLVERSFSLVSALVEVVL
jgi:hypothetical protein